MPKTYQPLLNSLNINFNDDKLLIQAFTHRSYLNEAGKHQVSNERLEFLGDAILSYQVSNHLYHLYPDKPEGFLTNIRSLIVKTETLAQVAQELDFGKYLLLSKGEEKGGGRSNISLLADTYEAFLGSLFLDQGMTAANLFLEKTLFQQIPNLVKTKLYTDYKSRLQEKVQETSNNSPIYQVVKTAGPDHNKIFWVVVVIDGRKYEIGQGKSKQEAEQQAAEKTLEKMQ